MAGLMQRIFGSGPSEPQLQVRQPAADPNAIANQPSGTSANGPVQPVLPLDNFKDVWKNPTPDPNAPKPDTGPLIPGLQPDKINEAVSKMDFLSGINPELLTKATSGDAQAFAQVVNTSIQKALAASTQLSGNMVEHAVNRYGERQRAELPKTLKEVQVNETRTANPVLNHPAASPMLDMVKKQIMTSKPHLSPSEINQQAEEMLTTFAGQLIEDKNKREAPAAKADPADFSQWG